MPRSASVRISAKFAGMISIPPSVKAPFHKVSSKSHTTNLTGSAKTTPCVSVNSLARGQDAFRFYTGETDPLPSDHSGQLCAQVSGRHRDQLSLESLRETD